MAAAQGAVLPPEKLLPKETLAVVTAPDTPKFLSVATNSTMGRFWRTPEMKPFRDKFEEKFKASIGTSLEKDFGLKWEDVSGLAQGQTTFAVLANSQATETGDRFALVLVIDAKDHADQLKKTLENVKKKWADAGKQMKVEKIHDFDFTTFTSEAPAPATKPDGSPDTDGSADNAGPPAVKKTQVIIGQVDTLLVAGSSKSAIEKILSRREGGLAPALDELPSFQADLNARLRNAPGYAWVNAKGLTDLLGKGENDDPVAPGALNLPLILQASGLNDITSAALTFQSDAEGTGAQMYVAVPEANRRGLIKAFALEAKDCSPPPFVPTDAVKFMRWRVNLRQTWDTLEKMLNDINPQYGSLLNYVLSQAGKDKDEKYDLKAELLDNLGDDIISYGKSPKGNTMEDFKSAPSLVLVGSPSPEKLAAAIRVGLGALAQASGGVKEQDFLGRKIYTLSMPNPKGEGSTLCFSPSGSYVAFSSQSEMVEEYLRSDEGKSKPLSGTDGLAAAAQKVGGMETGFFEFDNYYETTKTMFDLAHSSNLKLNDVLGMSSAASAPGVNPAEQLATMKEWTDFSQLPPFDAVSKYFYFGVQSVRFTPDGFSWAVFAPTPPKAR